MKRCSISSHKQWRHRQQCCAFASTLSIGLDVEVPKVSNSGRSILKYRSITIPLNRYRTFASIAILWYIEYRTSTSIRFFGGFVIACGHWWNLVGLSWRQSWGHLFICKLLQPLSKTLFYSILAKVCMILSVSTQGDTIPPSPFFVGQCHIHNEHACTLAANT